MIDLTERKALADMLIRCIKEDTNDNFRAWDDLDKFLYSKDSRFCDNAILGIGGDFWVLMDGEWRGDPVNVSYLFIFRILLFLVTDQEYVKPKKTWGRFLYELFFGFFHCCVIFIVLVAPIGTVLGFGLPPYWGWGVVGVIIYVVGMCLSRRNPKLLTPEQEEQAFWPFASRVAYLTAKEANGKRIEAIVDELSLEGKPQWQP